MMDSYGTDGMVEWIYVDFSGEHVSFCAFISVKISEDGGLSYRELSIRKRIGLNTIEKWTNLP